MTVAGRVNAPAEDIVGNLSQGAQRGVEPPHMFGLIHNAPGEIILTR
jgi:hypothetical protein